MPVPDIQEIKAPLLEVFKDEAPHSFSINEILEKVADSLGTSLEEMSSAEKTAFKNNINDAKTFLRKNKLLSHPSKNTYMITRAGLEELGVRSEELEVNEEIMQKPTAESETEQEQETEIPVDFSEQEFLDAPDLPLPDEQTSAEPTEAEVNDAEQEPEEFLEQDDPIDTEFENEEEEIKMPEQIPEENNKEEITENEEITTDMTAIEKVLTKYNEKLGEEILEKVATLHQDTFCVLVMDLLSKMGYRVFQNARYTSEAAGSDLIHGVILEDKAEMTPIYIQARKLSPSKSVGKADMQDFIDALADKGGKGLFATLGTFSEQAKICANDERIMLIDGKKLAGLMISHNFCVNTERIFELKSIDMESFNEYSD